MMTIYTFAVVALLFGTTIFVHELGHFLVARWLGLEVDAFAIGFGPAIWKREINGVVYKICWLPLGGYVALPQMDPSAGNPNTEIPEGERVLPRIAPWKKILVSIAGPAGNMIFAFFLACIVYWFGQTYLPPENGGIGFVDTNSPAYAAGLRTGDVIERLNGKPVKSWEDLVVTVAFSDGVTATVRNVSGSTNTMILPTDEMMGSHHVSGIGPMNYCYVLRVQAGSSAEEAGIRTKDKILEFNGVHLYSREHLIDLVSQHAGEKVPAKIERDGQVVDIQLTPKYDEELKRARIGIEFNALDVKPPLQQIKSHTMLMFRVLHALVTPKEAKVAAGGIGGPFAILANYWWSVQASFLLSLWFTVMINVNLAVFNLLPIPVLDGGHITLSVWEIVTRRQVGPKVVNFLWNVFACLLIGLILVLTFRDVNRYIVKPFTARAATNAPAPAK